ncbi:uncharacterized protein LOC120685384 isoform X2 [Panicum virgatum]|uniref:uncharacterized protein LOC120685384 isoform X2 n=1 Tax=Panicum virgatum TaxID=38727 RepID=UPI0019D5867D|nr:uncharacterized protein LOC120685384 isoform X2 [Panicum virgatum]
MARPIVTFSSLREAEDNRQGRSIDEVAFQLDEQTSLVNADDVKVITRPGVHGFELVNPELLDCKSRTKTSLEKAYRRMFKACMERCDNDLLTVEARIASLKRSLAIPNEDIPHMGPPANERNQVIQQVMYLPSLETKLSRQDLSAHAEGYEAFVSCNRAAKGRGAYNCHLDVSNIVGFAHC